MNRPMPRRDFHHRSPDRGGPSRSGGAVPGSGRLVSGTAAPPAAIPQIATRAPQSAHVCAEPRTWQSWLTQGPHQLGSLDQTNQEQQHNGSGRRSDQAPDQSTTADAKGAKEPASHESANNAKDQISDQTVAAAFHQLSGKPAGHQADDEKPQKIHVDLPRCEPRRRSEVANSFEQSWRTWRTGAIGSSAALGHRCTVGPRSFGARVGQPSLAGLLRLAAPLETLCAHSVRTEEIVGQCC